MRRCEDCTYATVSDDKAALFDDNDEPYIAVIYRHYCWETSGEAVLRYETMDREYYPPACSSHVWDNERKPIGFGGVLECQPTIGSAPTVEQ